MTRRSAPSALGMAACVAAATLLGACSFEDVEPRSDVRNVCEADAECVEGRCDLEAGLCVGNAETPLQVGFELRTNDRLNPGSSVSHWLGPYDVSESGTLDLEIAAPITVTGLVKDAAGELVQAEIKLVRAPDFLGAPAVEAAVTTLTDPIVALDGQPATFAVNVVSGETYEVSITPLGDRAAEFPPLRRTVEVPGGGSFFRIDVVYPAQIPVFRGVLVDEDDAPVDHLTVRAVERASGRVVSTSSVSGEGETPGAFELRIAPSATEYVLRVGPSPTRTLFPSVAIDPALLVPGPGDLVRVLVPTPEVVTFRGRAESEAEEPIAGVVVTFRASELIDEETQLSGAVVTSVTADEEGFFSAELVAGEYEILLSPPSSGEYAPEDATWSVPAVGAFRMSITESGGGGDDYEAFVLPAQPRLTATVATFDDRFMVGATIDATALGRPLPSSENRAEAYNRSLLGTLGAGSGGRLVVPLDPGAYDVVVKAPEDRGYPWLPVPSFEMRAGRDPAFFTLPLPMRLSGAVLTDDKATESVEVRAWALIAEGGSVRALALGRVVTDEDGAYSLLLPSAY